MKIKLNGIITIAAMLITAQFSNVSGQEKSKEEKLKRAVGQGTGVLDVKEENGVVKYVSVVGQARISTVLGATKGLITAKKRASLLADAAFAEWMQSEVKTVTKIGESTIIMLEGAEGPEVDQIRE